MKLFKYLVLTATFLTMFSGNSMAQKTIVTIKGNEFFINAKPTYPGRYWQGNKIQGLLMNSRMVQGIFDDLNENTRDTFAYADTKKWDADRNNKEFVANMPLWKSYGLNCLTINMQGGSPFGYGNFDFHNPGYNPDGSLHPAYMKRLDHILKKADELEMVVILGLFYFGQDQRLTDETAIKNAVDNMVNWLFKRKYRNVIIEIANESGIARYDHDILQPNRISELILKVRDNRQDGYSYLTGASFAGRKIPNKEVIDASDFILIHGNGAKEPRQIQILIDGTKEAMGKKILPVVINEDDHFDFDKGDYNMLTAIKNHVSWGYFDFRFKGETGYREGFQTIPVDWGINSERKKAFFNKVREITGVK